MGEDIYVYLESKFTRHNGDEIWLVDAEFIVWRNNHIQGLMKLNDEGDFNLKGLPSDCGEYIQDKYDNSENCTRGSWFTLAELERTKCWCMYGYEHHEPGNWPLDWEMVLAALRVFGDNGRIVFWFRY